VSIMIMLIYILPMSCLSCNFCLVPKGVPIGVKAVYYNATAAIVEWIPVNNTREIMKGDLIGYRVSCALNYNELY